MSYFNKRKNAFMYAFSGLRQAIKQESHMKIHLLAVLVVINLGFYFEVVAWEWTAITICIALVIGMELINTAIENLSDMVTKETHPTIKYIKDISAAAVLLACLAALITGLMIFIPYVKLMLSGTNR